MDTPDRWPVPTWTTAGKNGNALSFNGTSNLVSVADAADLDLTTGLTLEAWVRPTTLSGWRTVAIKEAPGGLAYALYAHDNAPRPAGTLNTGGIDVNVPGTAALRAEHVDAPRGDVRRSERATVRERRAGRRRGRVGRAPEHGQSVEHRGKQRLERVVRRSDRRRPHLQPRAERRRDRDRHVVAGRRSAAAGHDAAHRFDHEPRGRGAGRRARSRSRQTRPTTRARSRTCSSWSTARRSAGPTQPRRSPRRGRPAQAAAARTC